MAVRVPKEEKKQKSRFARLAGAIPDPIKDIAKGAGKVFTEVDKPLSNRLGVNLPGPADMILEELTRPTNLLVAAGGVGAAPRVARLGRVGYAASQLLEPAVSGGIGHRVLGEAAVSGAARLGSTIANENLPEGTPTEARVALGLAAGVLGAGGAASAFRGANPLRAVPGRVHIRESKTVAPRRGNLISIREEVPDMRAWETEARTADASVESQVESLTLAGNRVIREFPATKGKDGNWFTRLDDGSEESLYHVLANPGNYPLTPKQRSAAAKFNELSTSPSQEQRLHGVGGESTTLQEGENYLHRRVLKFPDGTEVDKDLKVVGGHVGSTLSVSRENARQFPDIRTAIDAGYVYDHPVAALAEHAAETLGRAKNTALANLLVPIGEDTSGIFRVPAAIRKAHDGIRGQLRQEADLARITGSMTNEQALSIEAYLNSGTPDIPELLKVLKGVNTPGITATRKQLRELLPEWRAAQKVAREFRKIPVAQRHVPGKVRVNPDIAPLLKDVFFNPADAKRIESFYTRGVGEATQVGKIVKGVSKVNQNITPIRALGDMSSLLNQLGVYAFSAPATLVKNFALATRDALFTPGQFEKWALENTEDGAAHSLAVLGKAGQSSDFQFSSFIARLPVFHQLQRHFEILTTRMRFDQYNSLVDIAERSGKSLTDQDKVEVARALNRLSGIATTTAGDAETLATFAPRFLRSGIETIWKAGTDGTIEGDLARQYLRNMVVGGQLIAFTAAVQQGRDPREVTLPFDLRQLEQGRIALNPNFGTIRIGGQDVSLYGRWDSLARMSVVSMDAATRAINEGDATQLFDAVGYFGSTKGSPVASFAYDQLIRGATFEGDKPISLAGARQSLTPFAVSGFVEDLRDGQDLRTAGLGATINFFGGKSRELTAFERLNGASQALYKKDWDNLTGEERALVEEAKPDLARAAAKDVERRAAQGDNKSQARIDKEEIDQRRISDEQAAYVAYTAGDLTAKQLNDAFNLYSYRAAKEKAQTDAVLGVKYEERDGPQGALSAWYDTFTQSEMAPDVPDFAVQEALERELFARIDAGDYGPPKDARAMIEGRRRSEHTPEVQQFFDAKDRINESGYYDVTDEVYAQLRPSVERQLGQPMPTFTALLAALNQAKLQNEPQVVATIERLRSLVNKRADPQQLRMRKMDPGLDEDLRMLGRVTKPARSQ